MPSEDGAKKRGWLRVALVAGTVQGSWAAFANHEHGVVLMVSAGLAQSAVSALGAATMTLLMDRLFRWPSRAWARFIASAGGSTLTFCLLIVGVHWLRGTPNLLKTIALPGTVLPIYAILYSLLLVRGARRGEPPSPSGDPPGKQEGSRDDVRGVAAHERLSSARDRCMVHGSIAAQEVWRDACDGRRVVA